MSRSLWAIFAAALVATNLTIGIGSFAVGNTAIGLLNLVMAAAVSLCMVRELTRGQA